jgi:hypothetical protein
MKDAFRENHNIWAARSRPLNSLPDCPIKSNVPQVGVAAENFSPAPTFYVKDFFEPQTIAISGAAQPPGTIGTSSGSPLAHVVYFTWTERLVRNT